MTAEAWRSVADFPDYEVSDQGRVRSLKYAAVRMLSTSPNRDGYPRVRLWRDNEVTYRFVHRLVAEAFIGERPAGYEVRHLNDDKADNRAVNIAYGTRSQNIVDAVRNGRQHQAAKTHCPQGHTYDEQNTYVRRSGWRSCRTCQSLRRIKARGAA